MAKSLYNAQDGVMILTDKNFTGGKLTVGFKGPGVIKAYAVWCPHCENKVNEIKQLAKAFKTKKIGLQMYVIEADQNRQFSKAVGITNFPTMLYVDESGNSQILMNSQKDIARDVPSVIDALCATKQKCLMNDEISMRLSRSPKPSRSPSRSPSRQKKKNN